MDKLAYFEEVYNQAFEHELEKIALLLTTKNITGLPKRFVRNFTETGRSINAAEAFPKNFKRALGIARNHPDYWPAYKQLGKETKKFKKYAPYILTASGTITPTMALIHPAAAAIPIGSMVNTALLAPGIPRIAKKLPWSKMVGPSQKVLPHTAY